MSKYLAEAYQLMQAHRFEEAAVLCRKALRKPGEFVAAKRMLADCHNNQGMVHLVMSRLLDDAEACFRQALAQQPDHQVALKNLAGLLVEQSRLEEAIPLCQRLVALLPADQRQTVLRDLAVIFQRLDRLDEAAEVLAELAALMPNDGSALLRDALLIPSVIRDREDILAWRQRIENKLDAFEATVSAGRGIVDPAWFPGTYFYLSYHGLDNRALHTRIATAYLKAAPSLAWRATWLDSWKGPGERIRVGLASRNFYNHSIGHTSRGLVEMLDRSRFEVVVIRIGEAPFDAVAAAIDQAADQVVTVPLDDLQGARETIAGLELDVLFWQDIGMEPFSYLLAFSRLAPVQLTSFGHPDTTGIANVDYFLSSDLYESEESTAHYSERLVTLPGVGTLAYYRRPSVPPAVGRERYGFAEASHIYLCPQTLFKFHPDMDDVFLAIVERDEQALIVLIDPELPVLRAETEARLARRSPLLAQRLHFVPRLSHDDYLGLIRCADVVLDTIHFNGQNTSLESFAMGVPIITLPGKFQRSRHTCGMYQAMDFLDLVAVDKDDYVAKALAVVIDPIFRAHCQSRIEASAGLLYLDSNFISACENALEDMVTQAAAA